MVVCVAECAGVGYVVPVRRPVTRDDPAIAAAEAADRTQAEYFLAVLSESSGEIDRRIAKRQQAMTRYETRRRVGEARPCRRMIRNEEYGRQRLEWMIAALYRRFPPRLSSGGSGIGR